MTLDDPDYDKNSNVVKKQNAVMEAIAGTVIIVGIILFLFLLFK